ncbi:MAG: serine hydrolase domain-containing protein [Isosphaeraceae bacterium]
MRHFVLSLCVSLLVSSVAWAGELPRAKPEEVGLSSERLAELEPLLRKSVEEGKVAGGVLLIARHGKVAWVRPFGQRDLASKTPMTEDTIFALMSMTKPITSVATLMLVEQGKLGLDDPVEKYLPAFKTLRVLGDARDDTSTEVATVPLKRPVLVRDLLAHTSGIPYEFDAPERLRKFFARDKGLAGTAAGHDLKTIAEQVERICRVPLAHQPGEKWTYGLNDDVLGRLIEVVSGQSFDRFLHENILGPLDMRDTSFSVPSGKRDRLATLYHSDGKGGLKPSPKDFGSETFFAGGSGLYSTARDYTRFAQMLLNGGELEGARILKPGTVAQMTTNQVGDISMQALDPDLRKYGFGLGVVSNPKAEGDRPVLDGYCWAGAFSTLFYNDRKADLVGVYLVQVLPSTGEPGFRLFRKVIKEAIEK